MANPVKIIFYLLFVCLLIFILLAGSKFFSRYLILPLGIVSAILTFGLIIKSPMESVAGPIGIGKMIGDTSSLSMAMFNAAFLSFAIGLTNILPLLPFDGGKIAFFLLRGNRFQLFFSKVSISLFVLLMAFAILTDLFDLFR